MRKKEGLIFANARAKSKENNLMSEERLHRISESKTVADAMRVLAEMNYAGGLSVEGEDFYSLLTEEERLATAFVTEAAPKDIGFECFFMRNDYHNAKAILKGKYGNIADLSEMILPDGNVSFSELKRRIEEGKTDFDPFLDGAVKKIERLFAEGKGTPRLIDVEIDKAMYENIKSRMPACDICIKKYFEAQVDLINIESWLRCQKIGPALFESGFLAGGTISYKQFAECKGEEDKLFKMVASTEYKPFLERLQEGLSVYETARDDFLLKIISKDKADMFSVAPVLGYYLAKINEVKILRVILVSIKNKIAPEEMKKRVRALYA